MPTILLTGATGYIASHTWLALLSAGYDVVGLDDFSNSSPEVLRRLTELSGRDLAFVQADVNDSAALDRVFSQHRIAAVMHFAAFKAVGESTAQPLKYYANNLGGLVNTLQAMGRAGVKTFVFSSSATVYGEPQFLPYTEAHPLAAMNVYGRTKLMGEQILRDLEAAEPDWRIGWLRYFNPVGAHESGRIGEDPQGIPNNLMPFVQQVAVGRREFLSVFGGDYDTPDGTGVRDYLHVMDLADGHVAALRYLLEKQLSLTVNLGTGVGYSVLDLVNAFSRAAGKPIPYKIVDRRPGDLPSYYADATLAKSLLGWEATRSLDDMCAHSWRWASQNPRGYMSAPGITGT
ncbi:MAG TPA: UDP-glucose 4-epimerase GalE [Ideonella sp.]|uniref:UDP-glucose 4-epimerase GalE n=1 Tax=Ideonella sp. TaxID=1929293 RepID=UPI002B769937|nr:UDP-glucose 4-epimerase GalE [Ideonella sp.]HSI50915.1 UDP-glucose 4-epimerase GalE [Ideonella sp.]